MNENEKNSDELEFSKKVIKIVEESELVTESSINQEAEEIARIYGYEKITACRRCNKKF